MEHPEAADSTAASETSFRWAPAGEGLQLP